MNKKLIFILLILIGILTGCSQNKNSTKGSQYFEDEKELKYEKETECSLANYTYDNNSDGIISSNFSITLFYNNLDDSTTYMENNGYITFNTWDNAKKYYNNHKDEYSDLNMELDEENIDTDNTGDITFYSQEVEENSPRNIIEEQKSKGFTCTTYGQ